MNRFCYMSCLLFISMSVIADNGLSLPTATSCSLDAPVDQQAVLLNRCMISAEAGDAEAQYQLGLYYSEGKYIEPNYQRAIHWFKQASMLAHVEAQVRLGYIYFEGLGVPVNFLQSYIIFKIAGINGSDEAMDQADIVAEKMTIQELQQANFILGKTFRFYLKALQKH